MPAQLWSLIDIAAKLRYRMPLLRRAGKTGHMRFGIPPLLQQC